MELKQIHFDTSAFGRRCAKALEKMRDEMMVAGERMNLQSIHLTSKGALFLTSKCIDLPMTNYWGFRKFMIENDLEDEAEGLRRGGPSYEVMGRPFNAAAKGLDSWLEQMKKDQVKHLKDEVETK